MGTPFQTPPSDTLNFDASLLSLTLPDPERGETSSGADAHPAADERLDRVHELLRSARQRLEGAVVVLAVGDDLVGSSRERQARIATLCADARCRLHEACLLLADCAEAAAAPDAAPDAAAGTAAGAAAGAARAA